MMMKTLEKYILWHVKLKRMKYIIVNTFIQYVNIQNILVYAAGMNREINSIRV